MLDHSARVVIAILVPIAALATTSHSAIGHARQPDHADIREAAPSCARREISPIVIGGRIADVTVHPEQPTTWYIAFGPGGVWKVTNSGITWTPSSTTSRSTPSARSRSTRPIRVVVWAGTGEYNSGRHCMG